ncbi:MAG: hypothetical protein ACT6FF_01085 [Methanosarcinaceae archaeon]
MKKFGEKFKEYKPFEIEHMGIPDTGNEFETQFFEEFDLDKDRLPEIMPLSEPYACKAAGGELYALKVLEICKLTSTIKDELNKIVIEVAPTANVYRIPDNQHDLAESIKRTLPEFNYYVVELGLNVLLGRKSKIPELLFEVDLTCDGKNREDVTAYDIAPNDNIKHIKVIGGKISLGITKYLKFIPEPIGEVISDLLIIDINPWEFEWGFDKYMIDAAGKKNYHIYWKIYETNIVQGFNPTMILKVRKGVNKISANVRAIYKLKGRFNITSDIKFNEIEINILPM